MESDGGVRGVLLFLSILTALLFLLNRDVEALAWMSGGLQQYQGYVEQSLAYFVMIGFATFAMKSDGISPSSLGISFRNLVRSLPVLLTLTMGTLIIAELGGGLAGVLRQAGYALLPFTLANVVFVAFSEEYVFRGYVQNAVMRRHGVYAGLIVSSLSFALVHLPSAVGSASSGSVALATLGLALLGRFSFSILAFSAVYQLTGNLIIPVMIHGFYDFTLYYFPASGLTGPYILLFLIAPCFIAYLSHRAHAPSPYRSTDVPAGWARLVGGASGQLLKVRPQPKKEGDRPSKAA